MQKWWREFRHPELLRLNLLEPYQIAEQLPQLFADDLNEYLDENPIRCPIFFFDTIENLIGKERDKDHLLNHDEWLRHLIFKLPRVFWVFFGKELLKWSDLHQQEHWEGNLHQHEVKGFSKQDFAALTTSLIREKDICDRIEVASATPSLRNTFNLNVSTYCSDTDTYH